MVICTDTGAIVVLGDIKYDHLNIEILLAKEVKYFSPPDKESDLKDINSQKTQRWIGWIDSLIARQQLFG